MKMMLSTGRCVSRLLGRSKIPERPGCCRRTVRTLQVVSRNAGASSSTIRTPTSSPYYSAHHRGFSASSSPSSAGGEDVHRAFDDMRPYQWDDPLLFRDTCLTDEERAVWDAAAAFCQQELKPQIRDMNRHERTVDHALMQEMGQVGLLGATIPAEYGGSGLGYVAYGLLATEVERVDSAFRSCMSVQSSLVMHPIYAYGSEALRRKYLPELAAGRMIGCFGLTEPNHGSDPAGMETRAVYDAGTDEYILTGSKTWYVRAKERPNGPRGFLT